MSDKYKEQAVRRIFMAGVVWLGLIAGGARALAGSEDQATIFGWTNYEVPEMYPAYLEKHGEPPNYAVWGDEEEGLAKARGGFQADVLFPCAYKIRKWIDAGVLQPIDTSRLKHWDDVIDSLKNLDYGVVDGKRYWVPLDWGQTSITYRTDLAPEYVGRESWEILWDAKYKGRVAMFDSLVDGVIGAAIVAGVRDPFDYTDDATLAKTRERMRALAASVRFFSNDPTTIEQALASGEIVAATTWNESLIRLKEQGLPVKFMTPKEGAMIWVCGFSIGKDARHLDKAYDVIDAYLDPRSRVFEMKTLGYGASTKKAFEMVDDAFLEAHGLTRNPDDMLKSGVFQRPIQGEERLQQMFDEVKAGM